METRIQIHHQLSIITMLEMLKKVLPRATGNGWKLQKFREHLHIPDDIEMYGSPKNFETGIWENRLIYVGKQHATSCQKRGPAIFTKQLGDRIYVKQCSEKCNQYLKMFSNKLDKYTYDSKKHIIETLSIEESVVDKEIEINVSNLDGVSKKTADNRFIINNRKHITSKWLTKVRCEIPPFLIE
jgi:hypothetical protein